MNDQGLIELLRSNKQGLAFKKLYVSFPKIKAMILTRGGSKQDADDVFQESLIILCRKVEAGNFTLSSGLGTYLFSIAKFIWNDELKKRNKTNFESLEEEQDLIDEVEDAWESEKKWKEAENVISGLGEKCIRLLQLFYFEKLSMKIIAKKMDYHSEKIAKNQKYKCLERAREKLNSMSKLNTK